MQSETLSSSPSAFHQHTRTHAHAHLPSLFSESLWFRTLLFHWLNKAINSFQIQLHVWRGAMEHEQQHLKRFPANTLLPHVAKAPCYYFQPFAFGDFSLFWGERALLPHECRATKTPRKVKIEMFPWYPAQGHLDDNIKLTLLGLNLRWHLRLRAPFCHQCYPPTRTHRRTALTGWIFSVYSSGIWLSRRVGTCRGKRGVGVVVAMVGRVVWSLKESEAAWQW